jgi:hypothetical protein
MDLEREILHLWEVIDEIRETLSKVTSVLADDGK